MDLGVIEFPFASLSFAANVVKSLKRAKGEITELVPHPEVQAAERFLEHARLSARMLVNSESFGVKWSVANCPP